MRLAAGTPGVGGALYDKTLKDISLGAIRQVSYEDLLAGGNVAQQCIWEAVGKHVVRERDTKFLVEVRVGGLSG